MKYSEIESQAPQKKSCLDVTYRWIILIFIMWLTFGILLFGLQRMSVGTAD
jgi:hypothetical protein